MKPIPIPTLEGKAVEEFVQDIKNGPTPLQKEIMQRALTRNYGITQQVVTFHKP